MKFVLFSMLCIPYFSTAIKAHNKDKYYLNGNWVIDLPRGYKIAGTRFYYKRPKRSQKFNEAIVSDGPTKEALDIMVCDNWYLYYKHEII